MACQCVSSSSYFPSLASLNRPKFGTVKPLIRIRLPISCHLGGSEVEDDSKCRKNHLDLIGLSVTLTVIAASLPQPSIAAKVSERKRSAKKTQVLTPQELKSWSQGLPTVTDRIPYTEILNLKREGKLKHIIKPASAGLKQRAEVILAVLEDSRVVRIVLPSVESDHKFWEAWDELRIDSVCMNAFSPPLKKPEIPSPYLGFLMGIPKWMLSLTKRKPQSKKALELKRVREELKMRRDEELARMRQEREMMEKASRMQKKMEERKKKEELKKIKSEKSLYQAARNYQNMTLVWDRLASDSTFSTLLGLLFFIIFYQTVVLSYKKQKKDYEERMKIEKLEAEERKKMRQMEREISGQVDDVDEDEVGKGIEENAYMKMAAKFMRSGARVRRAQGKLPQYLERDVGVKFSDVAGLGKIRLELEEVVKFFTHGEIYRRRGVRIPGGILLCGPPGVGKTLLAKAVAGEAGVNFFSISASQFVEMYVGVGAARVRSLYEEARENAPAIVFIDELDAVGRQRGMGTGSGSKERDATLNQLLVCLDGFEGRGNVITIASTNRADILDPALVRPGRFDRKIFIPKPGKIGRMEILKVHAQKKPMAEDVDFVAVADMTNGMVGAELANILEVAALNMLRDGRTEITTDDLIQAAQMEERGMLDKKERSPERWKQIAINEASMAVMAVNFPDSRNIDFLTIAPRAGRELGYCRVKKPGLKLRTGMMSRQSLLDHITVQLAPRAADEIYFGGSQLSTIWAENANNARSAARAFVIRGLSKRDYGLNKFWSPERINNIDLEAMAILNSCYERAKELLHQNRKLMDAVVDVLVEKKSLTKTELFNLVDLHGSLLPPPPSILDIRAAKRLEFKEMITNQSQTALKAT